MSANTSDKFTDSFNSANPNVAKVTGTRTAGVTTLACDNLAGWPTVSKVHFSTYQLNTSAVVVAGTQIDWSGIVSGNSIGSLVRKAGAADAGNAIGDVVEMNPTGSWGHDLFTGLTAEHSQLDGTHDATKVGMLAGTQTFTGDKTFSGAIIPSTIKQGWDGWFTSTDTWTYGSATTFTIAGVDRTAQFPVGAKLKLTQTTPKYFYVVTSVFSTNTTVTVTGGTDYTLANAAITSPFYSYMANPQGFPQWFAFTPGTTTGWSGTPTTTGTRFCIKGRECTYRFIVSGTSNTTGVAISLPVSAQLSATTGTFNFEGVLGLAIDNGTTQSTAHRQVIDPGTSLVLITCYHDMATAAWTGSGTKAVRGTAVYEI